MLEKADNEVRALSAISTHFGCTVQWRPEEKKFICRVSWDVRFQWQCRVRSAAALFGKLQLRW